MTLVPRSCVLILVLSSACGGSPSAPEVTSCQKGNTATITFLQNRSVSTTMDVLLDGAKIGTLAAGQSSPEQTIAAGVQHTVRFQITNTTALACNVGTPTLAQCEKITLFCPS